MRKKIAAALFLLLLVSLFSGCAPDPREEESAAEMDSWSQDVPAPPDSADGPEEANADPTPQPIVFTVDRHRLSRDAWEYLGKGVSDYEALVDGVLKKQESVSLSSWENAQRAVAVFEDSLYGAVADIQYNGETASIFYDEGFDPLRVEAALKDLVESSLSQNMNALEIALSLYRTVSSGMDYEDSAANSLYRAMTEHVGSSREFAGVLHCAFTQLGIDARIASCMTDEGTHYWVAAQIDGNVYHFDPTFEHSVTGGAGLGYFGMSDDMRQYTGCDAPYTLGLGDYAQAVEEWSTDDRFDKLFLEVTGWTLSVPDHTLQLAYGYSDEYSATVSTAS